MAEADQEALKKLHWMKCPKCGFDLHETVFRGIVIDKCDHCHGIFFDDGELEKLTGKNDYDVFNSILRVFKRDKQP